MKIISKVNQVNIVAIEEKNEQLVPIKPICDAIGISFQGQNEKIQNDEILGSTVKLSLMVGADKKEREMFCLPLKYVYGWLFTINPKNVKPEAQEAVLKYKMECYDVLYDYFVGGMHNQIVINKQEIDHMKRISDMESKKNVITEEIKAEKRKLDKIRQAKLKEENTPSMFPIEQMTN